MTLKETLIAEGLLQLVQDRIDLVSKLPIGDDPRKEAIVNYLSFMQATEIAARLRAKEELVQSGIAQWPSFLLCTSEQQQFIFRNAWIWNKEKRNIGFAVEKILQAKRFPKHDGLPTFGFTADCTGPETLLEFFQKNGVNPYD